MAKIYCRISLSNVASQSETVAVHMPGLRFYFGDVFFALAPLGIAVDNREDLILCAHLVTDPHRLV